MRVRRKWLRYAFATVALIALGSLAGRVSPASAITQDPGEDGPSQAAPAPDTYQGPGNNNPQPGFHDNGRGGNSFVNDPCLDPPPPTSARTVQSETDIAVDGKYMVAGYNDSYGFYDREEGLSGFAYSINGGNQWIDGGGLPPKVPGHGARRPDAYSGDPVVVVDRSARIFTKNSAGASLSTPIRQAAGQFYYASIYSSPAGYSTLSVNRGRFMTAPPQDIESSSNTRCLGNPAEQGIADTQNLPKERIIWEAPVEAIIPPNLGAGNGDFLDKEWLHVDQSSGALYLSYTRFGSDDSTPIELVRSFDGGRTWTPPSVIVPNLLDTFNQGTIPVTVPLPGGGTRVVVTWWSRTFSLLTGALLQPERIERAISNDNGATFGPAQTVATVYRQAETPGYNRRRTTMFNGPAMSARGTDVYIAYHSGKPPGNPPATGATSGPRPSDVFVSSSHDGGATFLPPVKVNDDEGVNSHVFPTVQVNKHGDVYVGWLDRRNDTANELTDTWAAVSKDGGLTFGHNKLQTDVATSWRVRADARPNFGDYISSDLIDDNQFTIIWADGRFPGGTFVPATCIPAPAPGQTCPPRLAATPDTIFTIANGLGVGN